MIISPPTAKRIEFKPIGVHMNTKPKAYMIIDLQFGSTGKGLLAGVLAKEKQPDVVATAWMPNAGHTFIDKNGRKFVHTMLANGIVSPRLRTLLLGAGSVINLASLYDEIVSCADLLRGKCIIIHPHAVIVSEKHRQDEAKFVRIGSTMKGSGAGLINRIERNPENNPTAIASKEIDDFIEHCQSLGIDITVGARDYDLAVRNADLIQIEGAQGYSLSMYHGYYPYTTSRDVTPAQMMADTCMPFDLDVEVYGTLRTYPIRVANRFDKDGNQIGTSGRGYPDQKEISWSDIGLEAELTTVTKLPRRIFTFSHQQTEEAIYRCAPKHLFINFCNYMESTELSELAKKISAYLPPDCRISYLGFGASEVDVKKVDWSGDINIRDEDMGA